MNCDFSDLPQNNLELISFIFGEHIPDITDWSECHYLDIRDAYCFGHHLGTTY